jgi:hypothetical protein
MLQVMVAFLNVSAHFGTYILKNMVRSFLVVNMVGSFLKVEIFTEAAQLAHFLTHVKILVMNFDDIVLPDFKIVRIVLFDRRSPTLAFRYF